MKQKSKLIFIWTFSVLFTFAFAYYQRKTGPTHPVTVKTEINQQWIKNKLIRTADADTDAVLRLLIPDNSMNGYFQYKRYKSYDEWHEVKMTREKDHLIAFIPRQPPAGKVMYKIIIEKDMKRTALTTEPVIIRFKGVVPDWILVIHVLLIFTAMMFSTRTGIEAIINGKHILSFTRITFLLLLVGGMILGPVVQKYAFDAFWTGWPIGHDLTDNKMAIAFIFWTIAFVQQLRNRQSRGWVILATFVLIIVFLIPHSTWGSEIDYTQQ